MNPSNTLSRCVRITVACFVLLAGIATARAEVEPPARRVDLVIALDVSGSMSGLIESAKQRLWDIANELGQARPAPVLRVAILSYGRPGYGAETGFVHLDLPFTSDLDAVNETLFAFGTDGGDEYVARVIRASLDQLQWRTEPDALRMIFVAGNESAEQDPQLTLAQVTRAAVERDIVVSAIYCGSEQDPIAASWKNVAIATNGTYASIDQNAAAVAIVVTPFDQRLAELNQHLNETYIAYGSDGQVAQQNQLRQDANAAGMSGSALASRAMTKAGSLYRASWDLVDAVAAGLAISEIESAELPAEMQPMTFDERDDYVQAKAERRAELRSEISAAGDERRAYIEAARGESVESTGLDDAIRAGIRSAAERKGFVLRN